MASGGSVLRYEGARGVVWRLRYLEAGGRRVRETLGGEVDGWTKRRAEEELRERLVAVKRDRRKRAQPITFAAFAEEWLDTYPDARGLKRSTRETYRSIVELHLVPAFGHRQLEAIDVEHLDGYLAGKRRAGYGPGTLNRHLNLLSKLYVSALRRQLVRFNPVPSVERPREPRRRWTILSPVEVGSVERAFGELAAGARDAVDLAWLEQARVVFLTVIGAGLRRGEVLGLRWRDVALADPDGAVLRVRETWVRGGIDTPKSEAGERTIPLGPVLAAALFEHRGRTAYAGDDERVFCHPQKGSPLDHKRYAETLRLALARAGVERPMRPFHDGRHSAITNDAAAGNAPMAVMKRAGHSDFRTTQGYIDLAGESFREEADRLDRRVFGEVVRPQSGPQ